MQFMTKLLLDFFPWMFSMKNMCLGVLVLTSFLEHFLKLPPHGVTSIKEQVEKNITFTCHTFLKRYVDVE